MLLGRAFKALQIWPHFSYPIIAASIPLQELSAPIREVSMPFSTRSRLILPSSLCSCGCSHLPPTPPPVQERPPSSIPLFSRPSLRGAAQVVACQGPWQPRPLPASGRNACSSHNMEAQAPFTSSFLLDPVEPLNVLSAPSPATHP